MDVRVDMRVRMLRGTSPPGNSTVVPKMQGKPVQWSSCVLPPHAERRKTCHIRRPFAEATTWSALPT